MSTTPPPEPMHFCFVNMPIEYYSPVSGGAIATIIAQTGRELIVAGHRVSVLTPMNDDPVYDIGETVRLKTRTRNDLSFIRRRWSGIRKRVGGWDWPYFEFYLRSLWSELLRLRPKPDVLILFNDLYTPPHIRQTLPDAQICVWLQNEWRTNPRKVERTAAATDLFLTCSQYIRDWTARTYGIPLEKFAVVPSGVNLAEFYPRADYLQSKTPPRVLFVGRIDRNKGPDIALDAVSALRSEGIAVEMTVAGGLWFYGNRDPMTDPFFRELRGKMDAVGADYRGHVNRDALPGLVREHDIACVLSRSNEPFGLVAPEAMASGCAVIASNRGGLPEACGDAALLVDPDDLRGVTQMLSELVTKAGVLADQKKRSIARSATAGWGETARRLNNSLAASEGPQKS